MVVAYRTQQTKPKAWKKKWKRKNERAAYWRQVILSQIYFIYFLIYDILWYYSHRRIRIVHACLFMYGRLLHLVTRTRDDPHPHDPTNNNSPQSLNIPSTPRSSSYLNHTKNIIIFKVLQWYSYNNIPQQTEKSNSVPYRTVPYRWLISFAVSIFLIPPF